MLPPVMLQWLLFLVSLIIKMQDCRGIKAGLIMIFFCVKMFAPFYSQSQDSNEHNLWFPIFVMSF